MPMPIMLAHRLTQRLAAARKGGEVGWLRPDGKSQVTVEYADGRPTAVRTVVVSTQHAPTVGPKELTEGVREVVIDPVLRSAGLESAAVRLLINPTGRFVVGGPQGDAGRSEERRVGEEG